MTVAYLGLGSNLGDARQSLKDAVVCLAQQHCITVLAKSSLYRTEPIDAQGDDFYNVVVKIETGLDARALLALCHRIEHHFGRERPYRNAPRTLDIDIILFGDERIDEPALNVPHPRAAERAFVLVPLLEIDADAAIPGVGRADTLVERLAHQRIEKVQTCRCAILDALCGRRPNVSSKAAGTCQLGEKSVDHASETEPYAGPSVKSGCP
jgi:2-amino-4-hydroxy-6-hydroxymethyldihydropteridine diphosphokinase